MTRQTWGTELPGNSSTPRRTTRTTYDSRPVGAPNSCREIRVLHRGGLLYLTPGAVHRQGT